MERTFEQLREHYEIEKELANRLKCSTAEERKYLYAELYDELFQKVPHHPQLMRKDDDWATQNYTAVQIAFLEPFIDRETLIAEIGPGDCSLSLLLTQRVKKVYAIDVSAEITKHINHPKNFELILSDGQSIPLPINNADIVYSDQLIEHLHPDDVIEQLKNILDVLKEGGKYICITPSRIDGPHDISKHFDEIAKGFHIKEYTFTDLKSIFKKAGFNSVYGYWGIKKLFFRIPFSIISFTEKCLMLLPKPSRKLKIFRPFLTIRVVGVK